MKDLLIIDYQNDFITGSLAVKNAPEMIERMKSFDLGGFDKIGLTLDVHPANHCSFADNGGLWTVHCVRGTEGAALERDLSEKLEREIKNKNKLFRFEKGTDANREEYSFLQNEVCRKKFVEAFDPKDELYVAGIVGDYCVYETLVDLLKLGYKNLIVLKSFISSIDGGAKLERLIETKHLKAME